MLGGRGGWVPKWVCQNLMPDPRKKEKNKGVGKLEHGKNQANMEKLEKNKTTKIGKSWETNKHGDRSQKMRHAKNGGNGGNGRALKMGKLTNHRSR